MSLLFDTPLIAGLRYAEAIIGEAEEQELIRRLDAIDQDFQVGGIDDGISRYATGSFQGKVEEGAKFGAGDGIDPGEGALY